MPNQNITLERCIDAALDKWIESDDPEIRLKFERWYRGEGDRICINTR